VSTALHFYETALRDLGLGPVTDRQLL